MTREEIEKLASDYLNDMESTFDMERLFNFAIQMTESCKDTISRQALLSEIETVCFSEEWIKFRVDYGSNGTRDYIINYIKQMSSVQPKQKTDWIAADPNNLPDNKVIYELTDGRKGIGVLFKHEFPYDGLSVCAMDEVSGKRHPFVGRWMPLPWKEGE